MTTHPALATRPSPSRWLLLTGALVALAAGCGGDDGDTTASGGAMTIEITDPDDGADVAEEFDVEVEASVPIGEPETGRHHVHLYYDGNTNEGEYAVVYENSFTVTGLPPGEHTIEAVIANADHSLTDARQEITVMVGASGGGTETPAPDDSIDRGY